ncbi:MAG: RDD family protein, partial [Gammaproteobacteria bacterium]|nr:RDD family protein [Gammaproteobacteria bacterium]
MQAKDYKQNSKQNVSLLRRFGAILYDSFLLLTALFVAAFLIVIPTDIKPEDSYFFLFQAYIFLIAYLFFAWFWT